MEEEQTEGEGGSYGRKRRAQRLIFFDKRTPQVRKDVFEARLAGVNNRDERRRHTDERKKQKQKTTLRMRRLDKQEDDNVSHKCIKIYTHKDTEHRQQCFFTQ